LLARFGYAPGDGRFLPYVLGGVAMTQLQAVKQVTFAGVPPPNTSGFNTAPWGISALHEGVVVGAGAQYAVTPWISVGVDYLYSVYGTHEHGGTARFTSVSNFGGIFSSSGSTLFNSPQDLTTHTARFVINFKLD
jgi:opacity protein-like surface antigen